jgi:hypothetical protein
MKPVPRDREVRLTIDVSESTGGQSRGASRIHEKTAAR